MKSSIQLTFIRFQSEYLSIFCADLFNNVWILSDPVSTRAWQTTSNISVTRLTFHLKSHYVVMSWSWCRRENLERWSSIGEKARSQTLRSETLMQSFPIQRAMCSAICCNAKLYVLSLPLWQNMSIYLNDSKRCEKWRFPKICDWVRLLTLSGLNIANYQIIQSRPRDLQGRIVESDQARRISFVA